MDRKYIEENEIEIKYLRNQLTPDQLEEFEVYLMENPEAIEGLELIETLTAQAPAAYEKNKTPFVSKVMSLISASTIAAYGLGALTAFAVFLGVNTSQVASSNKAAFSQVVYLSPNRGNGKDQKHIEVKVPDLKSFKRGGNNLVLVLDTNRILSSVYFVEILNSEDEPIQTFELVMSDGLGQLTVVIPADRLSDTLHKVLVKDSANEIISTYNIKLI